MYPESNFNYYSAGSRIIEKEKEEIEMAGAIENLEEQALWLKDNKLSDQVVQQEIIEVRKGISVN